MRNNCAKSLIVSQALLLSACGIHPLPEDVTPLDTNAVVLQIRCEARDGLKNAILDFLLAPKPVFPIPESTLAKARQLQSGALSFAMFDPDGLDPISRYFLLKYENAAIGYDFQFDMSVNNDATAEADFTGIIPHQIMNANAGGAVNLKRQTIRNFRVTDTFGELRRMRRCDYAERMKFENYVYPVTGRIGLDELVKTFVDLNEINNLAGKDDKATVPIIADTFTFSTKLAGSAAWNVNLTPETRHFHLLRASAGVDGSRTDAHQVVVAMSLDPKTVPKPLISQSFVGVNFNHAGFGRTRAEESALFEINYQKNINSLNNIALRPN